MIRQRAQAFKSYFKDKKPENAKQSDDIDHSSHGTYLNMESFPSQNISSVNNEFLGELMNIVWIVFRRQMYMLMKIHLVILRIVFGTIFLFVKYEGRKYLCIIHEKLKLIENVFILIV